jgi:hypothetical protein
VQAFFYQGQLSDFIPGTRKLPGVHHTEPLTELAYPEVGSVRLICLTDGNTAEEEVLSRDDQHLRYLVSNYTSPQASPIQYAVGEFRFSDAGDATRITWSYSFKLRRDKFPGSLGSFGRFLFRLNFLDLDYADFMESVGVAIQRFGQSVR